MNYNKEFQQRFSELAWEISTSNSELAQILDIDRKTLGNYINTDRALPSAENLIKISKNAKANASKDVSVDWLLGLVPRDNPSSDEKFRTVAEYTGLCDDAITRLNEFTKDENWRRRLKIINAILSDNDFYNAVIKIDDACYMKTNLPPELVPVQLREHKQLHISPDVLIGTAIGNSVDYFKAVISRVVKEA